jgi:endoglucanase
MPTFFGYADTQGWSYLAWTWNPWQDPADVLIADWTGTPTAGEGAAWKAHLLTFPFEN